ncbi:hypothetical protein niasHT_001071 [Heterodera trifolii]|uniref:Uncharacterized protein n=1 Tax=Heterodera trifolii TaxID=157864 RepID=A0ABD2MBF5_9BILA
MILIILIFKIFAFANGQPSPAEQHIRNVPFLGISADGAGPSSAFEHRIDMPNEVPPHSFFEYLKLALDTDAKIVIGHEQAIEFLKVFPHLRAIIQGQSFIEARVVQHLSYLTILIDHAIDENRNKIGDQMYAFVTNLSNICEQLGTVGMDNVKMDEHLKRDLAIGKRLCFVGFFTFVAETINNKMSNIIMSAFTGHVASKCVNWLSNAVRRNLRLGEANEPNPTTFLRRQNTSELVSLHFQMSEFGISIEQILRFWARTMNVFIGDNNLTAVDRIESQNVKQQLTELTEEAIRGLLSTKIELVQCEN